MKRHGPQRGLRFAAFVVTSILSSALIPASVGDAAGVDTTQPTDTTQQPDSTDTTTTTQLPVSAEPVGTQTPETSESLVETTQAPESTEPVDTTEPPASSAPVDTTEPPASSEPPETSAPPETSTPAESSLPDCTPVVDGDGPVTLPEGCATTPPPSTAANPPPPSGACGLRVTIVVDASASIDTGAVRATLSAIVDALFDTDSTLAIVEFSSAADVRIGATPLDAASRDSFDGYIARFSAGGSSNLGAGLAAATAGSPDITVVVTDGVVNAGGANPGEELAFTVEQANQLKALGSRIVAIGVGNADSATLAAISGPAAGSDYSVGGADAIAASLGSAASDGCAPPDAAAADIGILAGPTDFPNPGAITIPASGSANQMGPAAPYPSSITVSGMTGLVSDVNVHLFGVNHGIAQDIDLLLVGPGGRHIIVMSDVADGGGFGINNANITFDDDASTGVPTSGVISGTVTFRPTNNAPADSFPAPAPPVTNTSTSLDTTFQGIDANGTWSLYAVDDLSGDTGSIGGGWSLTVTTEEAAVATSTAVTSSLNPSTTGANVTFTATVTSGGSPVPTGTVTFTDEFTTPATVLGTDDLNASGQATFSTTTLAEGTHTIRATFNGSTGFLTSDGTITQIVDTPTSTPAEGMWCNTGPITVPAQGPATPYPSRITISDAGQSVTRVTVQLGGVSHQVPFDLDVLLVGPAGQNIVLMSDVGGNANTTNVTLTFADSAGGTIPAGGPLTSGTFSPSDDDSQAVDLAFPAPAPAASTATALSTFNGSNPNGVWSLFVLDDASGDSGSIGGGWCLNISTAAVTQTALASSANPSSFGQAVTFTATVTSAGNPVSEGTVTFTEGTTTLDDDVALNAQGQATFTTNALTVGPHAITATYSGSPPNFLDSSAQLIQNVTQATTTTALASSLNPSFVGQQVTFTATVSTTLGPVTAGTVTFTDESTTPATVLDANVSLNASGVATFATSTLTAGSHTIRATYNGTASFATSNGSLDQAVIDAETGTALTSSVNPSVFGQAVTFTATVTIATGPNTGSAASGTVTFTDGPATLATVTLDSSGEATFTTSALSVGTHTITATYNGATGVATSSSSTLQVVDGVADAGGLYAIDEGGDLALDGSASIAGAGATFSWDVNNDGTFGDATGATPTLTWVQLEALGITDSTSTNPDVPIIITLQLTDGPTFTATTELTILNVAPTATFANDGPVAEGSTATVTFSGQSDPSADDLANLTYSYDFDNDGIFEVIGSTSDSETVPASFLPNGPATVTVRGRVADDDGGSLELTTDITVTNAAANVTINGPSTATVGVPVTLKVGADDPSAADMAGTFSYTVDWGDGSPAVTLTGPADPPVTHTYTDAGTFTVSATVTDPDGSMSEPLSFTMTVIEQVTPSSTTTTAPTTTAPSSTPPTSTSEPGATTPTTATSTPGATTTTPGSSALPRTGSATTNVLLVALALFGAGAAVVVAARKVGGSETNRGGRSPAD